MPPLPEEKVARRAIAIRLRGELTELSKELRKWQDRVTLAEQQNRTDLVEPARQRVAELTEKGRLLWKQLDEVTVDERLEALEIDDELLALKHELQPQPPPPSPSGGSSDIHDAEFEPVDDELEALKRQMRGE